MLLIKEVSYEIIAYHWQEVTIANCAILRLWDIYFIFIILLLLPFLVFFALIPPVLLLLCLLQLQQQRVFLQHSRPRISLTPLKPSKLINTFSVEQNKS